MRHVVLATAGHIDHGKTELTRVLTGIDTDRLPEEKARGITIDLGFAHFQLGPRMVAVVDVPGHERFVKNMLAGVGGVDLALLVVAADESVMPQTREHLAILRLLGVTRAVVALSKADLVDADTRDVARLEVAELLQGSPLEGAPILPVSARTGEGLEALRAALEAACREVEARDPEGPFRMNIDRVFTVHGFGTVVTGTVISGAVAVGDELDVMPDGLRARVRGLEVHGGAAERVEAGCRAAVNLAQVERGELRRGQTLVPHRLFRATSLVDARLELLAEARELRELARVRFHLGAAETLARVKHLSGERLGPGEHGWVQLRLERPVLAWPGDRFILRSYSPMVTIGGGSIVDAAPPKHRGRSAERAARLERLARAPLAERLLEQVRAAGERGADLSDLVAANGVLPQRVASALADRSDVVRAGGASPRLFARLAWERLADRVVELVGGFHEREPLREGMSREELKTRLFGEDAASARQLLDELVAAGRLAGRGDAVALGGHRVTLNADETEARRRILEAYRQGGLTPPAFNDVVRGLGPLGACGSRVLPVLVREALLVPLPGGLYVHAEAVSELKRRLTELAGDGRPLSVADFKNLTGTSRKTAIPLLEYLDSVRFTRRQGDLRVVVARPPGQDPGERAGS